MKRFDYLKPKSIDEALSLLGQYGERAVIIAGGTDVMVQIRKRELAPEALISLCGIPELAGISGNGSLRIGPLTTHREIEKSALISRDFPALTDAVRVLGSVQIRNVASIGGNICTAAPSADTVPPLLALGADIRIKNLAGERVIPLADFFLGPGQTRLEQGEILTEIIIPRPGPYTSSAYWKHQRRGALDLPIIGVAVLISLNKDRIACADMLCQASAISAIFHRLEEEEVICEEVRIALGVAAPTAFRAVKAEQILRGRPLGDEILEEAAQAAVAESSPRDSLRGEAWYRRDMISVLVKRMVMRAVDRILQPEEQVFPSRLW